MKKPRNWTLLIGIAIPIIFIAILCLVVFLPSFFVKPQYNFLFSQNNTSYYYSPAYKNIFSVENGRLIATALPEDYVRNNPNSQDYPPLYEYNVKDDTVHQISKEDADKLILNVGPSSPDGYLVQYQSHYGNAGMFGLFGYSQSNESGYYISKGRGQKKLKGMESSMYGYYDGNYKFIGWIK